MKVINNKNIHTINELCLWGTRLSCIDAEVADIMCTSMYSVYIFCILVLLKKCSFLLQKCFKINLS